MLFKKLIASVFLTILMGLVATTSQAATPKGTEIILGTQYNIPSKIFGGNRQVIVSLPEGYDGSTQNYPVVYVTRAELYFKDAVAFTSRLSFRESMPKVIVVGLIHGLNDNPYLIHGSEKADIFTDFLETEIFPFVENNFRTVNNRTIVGWHYTSSFAIHALLSKPELFDGYIVASPFPLKPDKINLDVLKTYLAKNPGSRKTLYFGSDPSENSVSKEMKNFEKIWADSAPKGLNWHVNNLAPDTDLTDTIYRLLHPGLREVFRDYKMPRFRELAAFNEWGGLEYLKKMVADRALKYGGSDTLSPEAIFNLAILARGGDDIDLFETAMGMTDLLANMSASVIWFDRFAKFYIKNGKFLEAIDLYERTIAKYPPLIGLFEGLAQAYDLNGQKTKAVATYKQAITLAEEKKDDRVASLKGKLAALK